MKSNKIAKTLSSLTIAITTVLIVVGCSTMDKGECVTANWHQLGIKDGNKGYNKSNISKYASDCGEHGIRPNQAQYLSGWQKGIVTFCTRDNGFYHGIKGRSYENSCPASLKDKFYSAYLTGKNVYREQSVVSSIQYKLNEIRDELADKKLSDADRATKKSKLKKLKIESFAAYIALSFTKKEAQDQGFKTY